MAYVIYARGSYDRRQGGWSVYEPESKTIVYGPDNQTPNQADLLAVKHALEYCKNFTEVYLYIESEYVQNILTKWIKNWTTNGWLTVQGKEVANKDLLVEISGLLKRIPKLILCQTINELPGEDHDTIVESYAIQGRKASGPTTKTL